MLKRSVTKSSEPHRVAPFRAIRRDARAEWSSDADGNNEMSRLRTATRREAAAGQQQEQQEDENEDEGAGTGQSAANGDDHHTGSGDDGNDGAGGGPPFRFRKLDHVVIRCVLGTDMAVHGEMQHATLVLSVLMICEPWKGIDRTTHSRGH